MLDYKTREEIEKINTDTSLNTAKSFAPFLKADLNGYCTNSLRFATVKECDEYLSDCASRWTLVLDTISCVSSDEPNYTFTEGNLKELNEVGEDA
jgi:hypothetical protein